MDPRLKKVQVIAVIVALSAILLVVGKYFYHPIEHAVASLEEAWKDARAERERQSYQCPPDELTIQVEGGKVCRESDAPEGVYRTIFDTYPSGSGGKEAIYESIAQGSIENANLLLEDQLPIDRYETVAVSDPLTWDEDPFGEAYWRFQFYGFRPFDNLFYAFDQTYDHRYLEKALDITLSFIDHGAQNPKAWEDNHAVAFRTMFLVKLWWQLRHNNLLTYDANAALLKSIQEHADFLTDPNHYEKGFNHGVNEAAALLLVGANFPELDANGTWIKIARGRLEDGLESVVDADGVLIENSPYYHFYTLEKFWQIYTYSKQHDVLVAENFAERMSDMIEYATYILQPDSKIPKLGASLDRYISYNDIYREIAQEYPHFKFVLTHGRSGTAPPSTNHVFPESGEVIMRSGWGDQHSFEDQTQLVFNAGAYRTNHSDLDALSFSLFGNGINLITDSGLFTYEPGPFRNYFHGTSAHNTVVVDNKDQNIGKVSRSEFLEGEGFASQAAEHALYPGVTHRRSMTLLGKRYVLIVDKLVSDTTHDYKQTFHIFPGASITGDASALHVAREEGNVMNLYQITPEGITLATTINQTNPPKGICSLEYEKFVPCYDLEYEKRGADATYVTLIEIGKHDNDLTYGFDGTTVTIHDSSRDYAINVSEVSQKGAAVTTSGASVDPTSDHIDVLDPAWRTETENVAYTSIDPDGMLHVHVPADGHALSVQKNVGMDLRNRNIFLKLKSDTVDSLQTFELYLQSGGGAGLAQVQLHNMYRERDAGQWVELSIGKSLTRSTGEKWRQHGNFDWSNIDEIRIEFQSTPGVPATVEIAEVGTIPEKGNGAVVIIFDDGYTSILPAYEFMRKNGLKGNVAVIADRVKQNNNGYLSLSELREMQNEAGWDMVNHSEHHVDAFTAYYQTDTLPQLESDILQGAEFLQKNGLNSAPNWYVYPHGSSNAAIESIIGKYYLFARTTINAPETYPFGDPIRVKALAADAGEGEGGAKEFISVTDLVNAVNDAKRWNQPLLITFHRIHATPTDRPGYDLSDFEKFITFLVESKTPVMTLSEFDAAHGIPEQTFVFNDTAPQLSLAISVNDRRPIYKIKAFTGKILGYIMGFPKRLTSL